MKNDLVEKAIMLGLEVHQNYFSQKWIIKSSQNSKVCLIKEITPNTWLIILNGIPLKLIDTNTLIRILS